MNLVLLKVSSKGCLGGGANKGRCTLTPPHPCACASVHVSAVTYPKSNSLVFIRACESSGGGTRTDQWDHHPPTSSFSSTQSCFLCPALLKQGKE